MAGSHATILVMNTSVAADIHKIEVAAIGKDPRVNQMARRLAGLNGARAIKKLSLLDTYVINKKLSSSQLQKVAASLHNPVTQTVSYYSSAQTRDAAATFDWSLEIGFLPGVTDNVGQTAREMIADLLGISFTGDEAVFTSQVILLEGNITHAQLEAAGRKLANPLIQRILIHGRREWEDGKASLIAAPMVKLKTRSAVSHVRLDISDAELTEIGAGGVRDPDGSRRGPLAMSLASMKAVQAYFAGVRRAPTDIELESIAQTWSEHCKHTIFADPIDDLTDGIYKTYIRGATERIRRERGGNDICVSVFTDNAGAIRFDDDHLVTHKVETHNTPSALDPFGGGITGIVGVNRDTIGFGLGAKPVANVYGFCVGEIDDEDIVYRDRGKKFPALLPRRVLDGVVEAVNAGGNQSGIPTPQGFVWFDRSYKGKPMVFVGTIGLIPDKVNGAPSHKKKARPGDLIVMVGGRVGMDGIHGATFSSELLSEDSPATAVQIGDPITQKKMSDALVKEARDLGLYRSITDNGAGGLSCSVAEMARESGGFRVRLEKIPVKYPNIAPWQIWISESQERMTLAVPPGKWPELKDLLARRGVEATEIGEFSDDGRGVITLGEAQIFDLDMEFLHNGLPAVPRVSSLEITPQPEPKRPKDLDFTHVVSQMLERPNLSSFEFISRQYDHEVQAGSVLKPLSGRGRVNADASVTRPLLSSPKGLSLSQSLYPTYSELDPYRMAAACIDTAVRNLVAVGTDPDAIAILDNFCWCDSNNPQRLGQLKEAARACFDYAVAYQTPFISGKDSMFNDFAGFDASGKAIRISALPTLLISAIGIMPDARKAVSPDIKCSGDIVYLLGETSDELGGSEYFGYLSAGTTGTLGRTVPKVNAAGNRALYRAVAAVTSRQLVASAISVGRGGLGVALARMCMAGQLGVKVSIESIAGDVTGDETALFSESQGRLVVTVAPDNQRAFEQAMAGHAARSMGTVTAARLIDISGTAGQPIVSLPLDAACASYRKTFGEY